MKSRSSISLFKHCESTTGCRHMGRGFHPKAGTWGSRQSHVSKNSGHHHIEMISKGFFLRPKCCCVLSQLKKTTLTKNNVTKAMVMMNFPINQIKNLWVWMETFLYPSPLRFNLKTKESPLKIDGWVRWIFLLKWSLFRGHVNFPRGVILMYFGIKKSSQNMDSSNEKP